MSENKRLLLEVQEAFQLYPKQCRKVLRHFGYYEEQHQRWTIPDDMWLYYEGAGADISYCSSSERWLSHADLLMCALYYLMEKSKKQPLIDFNVLYNAEDPLRFLLEQINIEDEDD